MEQLGANRPLTARSVIASTLLGTHPPQLPSRLLVRSGELFGITEGTVRTAISRMLAAGELEAVDGAYRLAGALLERQARQDASRRGDRRRWTGSWELAVVPGRERRDAATRGQLRDAMRRLHLAELREGVWLRPDNLHPRRAPEAAAIVAEQCTRFSARPGGDPGALAARLWDLDGWAATATRLERELRRHLPRLERGDASQLRDAFVVSAAVLRHLLADPLLPEELLPADWPGQRLRVTYERFDAAFKATWRTHFRAQGSTTTA
ncbi:PaaX family transcriptional regulator C-terminal domain-containing protein [Rhabdothermincola sediminis]|uniref:PaaX family transcriptional regulator C-terminal domain-containing protein n=1 Tax=Rhabdothermincola sediminis TaxID=2751370 RepID=UPI001AA06C4F|nr:PaaX family transcriptional regulator C-terminal domain-containing protein [Rhabdothermincola sediminis]